VIGREPYLATIGAAAELFDTYWGREWLETIAAKIAAADRGMLDRLRLIWIFSGLPITPYRRPETFPRVDPIFDRYQKLRACTPEQYRFTAPPICSEAGRPVDGGLVNVDVAITQERLQFFYFGGIVDWLRRQRWRRPFQPRSMVEIGAGCGMLTLAIQRTMRPQIYYIVDVPEILTISFAYLNLTVPDQNHYVVLPDGTYLANTNARVDFASIKRGIVYVPNYMMHRHGDAIAADLAINAVSLHELPPAQIAYYCGFLAGALRRSAGIYVDINAHRGQCNPKIDAQLSASFAHMHPLDFEDIGLSPRLFTNSAETHGWIVRQHRRRISGLDPVATFRLDTLHDDPPFSELKAQQVLNEDLGSYIGLDFVSFMRNRGSHFGEPLGGYENRHLYPVSCGG
jgi:hypothetical protein